MSAEIRAARTCYNHLAGDLGLRLADLLVREGIVGMLETCITAPVAARPRLDRTPPARRRPGRRPGPQLRASGWITLRATSMAVRLTEAGEQGLAEIEGGKQRSVRMS